MPIIDQLGMFAVAVKRVSVALVGVGLAELK
jgi:hypothetical protein